MSKSRWLGLSVGLILSGAAFTGSALADNGATAARSGVVSGALVGGTLSGGLTWTSSATPANRITEPCFTVPDEPCYVFFITGVGNTIAQASFSESPAKSVINKCPAPYVSCSFTDVATPYGDLNFVVDWYLSGPDVRSVETY